MIAINDITHFMSENTAKIIATFAFSDASENVLRLQVHPINEDSVTVASLTSFTVGQRDPITIIDTKEMSFHLL